jgi:hypothetical protein
MVLVMRSENILIAWIWGSYRGVRSIVFRVVTLCWSERIRRFGENNIASIVKPAGKIQAEPFNYLSWVIHILRMEVISPKMVQLIRRQLNVLVHFAWSALTSCTFCGHIMFRSADVDACVFPQPRARRVLDVECTVCAWAAMCVGLLQTFAHSSGSDVANSCQERTGFCVPCARKLEATRNRRQTEAVSVLQARDTHWNLGYQTTGAKFWDIASQLRYRLFCKLSNLARQVPESEPRDTRVNGY